jgi:hypothetical protein
MYVLPTQQLANKTWRRQSRDLRSFFERRRSKLIALIETGFFLFNRSSALPGRRKRRKKKERKKEREEREQRARRMREEKKRMHM